MPQKRRKPRRRKKQRKTAGNIAAIILLATLSVAFMLVLNEKFFHWDFLPTVNGIMQSVGITNRRVEFQQGETAVHFIDVGQGDCVLIESPGKNVLIDCGERSEAAGVVGYLRDYGITRLDYVIATHQHSDHMGGMAQVLRAFDVGEFIMPDIPDDMIPTSQFYSDALDVIEQKGIKATYACVGRRLDLSEGTVLEILSPIGSDYSSLNSYSVVTKLTSGNISFLFTGDIEKEAETLMTDAWLDIRADVLKVAHHGSSSSSCTAFLKRVRPEYAVISVGADNAYGHPSNDVIDRLDSFGCGILMTMEYGNIVFVTDGNELKYYTPEKAEDAA